MEKEFIKVRVQDYVKKLLENGEQPFEAVKFARIIARQGTVGEEVTTYSQGGIVEKVASVELDEKTQQPGWVVTKADEEGNAIVDEFGHTNTWIISDSTFTKKYEQAAGAVYKPKGGVQVFIRIANNITLTQWGSEMNIAEGGYINITNVDDMYGISERDFTDTYKRVESDTKKKELK